MAGSYDHCTDEGTGAFTGIELLDNMGDAHEALEEMHWMINYLAGGDRDKIKIALNAFYQESNAKYGRRKTFLAFCLHCLTYGTPKTLGDRVCGNCGKDGCRMYESVLFEQIPSEGNKP